MKKLIPLFIIAVLLSGCVIEPYDAGPRYYHGHDRYYDRHDGYRPYRGY